MTLETVGCGIAPKGTGSGVLVGDRRIMTAAHVVIRSSEIWVTLGDGTTVPGTILELDVGRDLALLGLDDPSTTGSGADGSIDQIAMVSLPAQVGDQVRLVGGASSGSVDLQIERVLRLDVETVGVPDERAFRQGYELRGITASGDSGGGVYDTSDRLVGVVFASTIDNEAVTWMTAASEVEAVLTSFESDDGAGGRFRCDSDSSKVVAT